MPNLNSEKDFLLHFAHSEAPFRRPELLSLVQLFELDIEINQDDANTLNIEETRHDSVASLCARAECSR
jgi:hypothetical protein